MDTITVCMMPPHRRQVRQAGLHGTVLATGFASNKALLLYPGHTGQGWHPLWVWSPGCHPLPKNEVCFRCLIFFVSKGRSHAGRAVEGWQNLEVHNNKETSDNILFLTLPADPRAEKYLIPQSLSCQSQWHVAFYRFGDHGELGGDT